MYSQFDVEAARSSFEEYDLQNVTPPLGGIITNSSWSAEEDYDLCYIYCALSVDPIRGADQSSDTFWGKIANCYNRKNLPRSRSIPSIKGRYSKINRQTQVFDSQVFKLKQTNPSGLGNETNLRNAANKLFKQVYKPDSRQAPHFYQFMHVYDILVEHVKWKSSLTQTVQDVQSNSGRGKSARLGENSSPFESQESTDFPVEVEGTSQQEDRYARPIGAKAAKKKQAAGSSDAEIKKLLVESEERYERAMHSRAMQHQERMARLDRLLAGNQQRDEDALMLMDTSFMTDEQRAYTESRRREIMRRRSEEDL